MNIAVNPSVTLADIKTYIAKGLAAMIEVDVSELDNEVEFDRYGLDSAQAVEMTDNISNWLGHEVDPTLLYDYSTINKLSLHLLELVNGGESISTGIREVEA